MAWVNKFVAILFCIVIFCSKCIVCNKEISTGTESIDQAKYRVHNLLPGLRFNCCPSDLVPHLEIFCYLGHPKHVVHIWETVSMDVGLPDNQYEHYMGSSPREVVAEYEEHRSSWTINPFSWRSKEIKFQPFNESCVGISSTHRRYTVFLHVIRVNYWLALLQVLGVVLYFAAPKLSGNPLFFYLCGVSLGIGASFLVLIYLLSKLFPKRPLMYGFVVGGWAVGVYVLQMLWDNLRVILFQYQAHVLVYCGVTGLISFVVCYRLGPVTDPRSKNLIQWTLQGVAFVMIFLGSPHHEASVALVAIIMAMNHFPLSWSSRLLTFWKKKFPPKVKLISENEYHEQGARETKKALDELRGYCSSPDCNAWRTVLALQTPVRFAKFMDGGSHLNDDEMLNYEMDSRDSCDLLTDDSDSE